MNKIVLEERYGQLIEKRIWLDENEFQSSQKLLAHWKSAMISYEHFSFLPFYFNNNGHVLIGISWKSTLNNLAESANTN